MSFSGMPVLFKHMAISSWDIFSSVYARIPLSVRSGVMMPSFS